MAIEINIPNIGIDELEVTDILVKIGDEVVKEQSLITVEGNKVSMEIPAPQSGIVKEIKISIGDKIKTNQLIMIFDEIDSIQNRQVNTLKKTKSYINDINQPNNDINQPNNDINQTNKEVKISNIVSNTITVIAIFVKKGDFIKKNQLLITVEYKNSIMEVLSLFKGTVKNITINIGDKIKPGSIILIFNDENAALMPTFNIKENLFSTDKKSLDDVNIHASPSVRRLSRNFGIDLVNVIGTGRKKRILREDIYTYLKELVRRVESPVDNNILPKSLPSKKGFDFFGKTQDVELGQIQKLSGVNLQRNWVTIPHITQFDEADITEIENFRLQQNSKAKEENLGVKITILVFVMKAVAKALEKLPRFNSSLSENGQKLILKKYINIGVAVNTVDGLVVPVLRNINKKGIIELSRELIDISQKARNGKLTAMDMQGGCFTISNLGSIGGSTFTPIINSPEVAILGISRSVIKQVWNGKKFIARLILPLSLSYDHRVIDGVDGARFISFINNIISDIRHLIM